MVFAGPPVGLGRWSHAPDHAAQMVAKPRIGKADIASIRRWDAAFDTRQPAQTIFGNTDFV